VSGILPVSAQTTTCTPLKVVGGQGTEVKKSVSPPGTLATRNNWNTDFAVPGGTTFQKFTAIIVPQDSGKYDITVNLKYSNKTSTEVYKKNSVELTKGQPLKISGSPSSNNQPYQVAVQVGGVRKVGKTYSVSVVGCP
jgi:hypothetical protein